MIKDILMMIVFVVFFIVTTIILKKLVFEKTLSLFLNGENLKIVTSIFTIAIQITLLYLLSKWTNYVPFINMDVSIFKKFLIGSLVALVILGVTLSFLKVFNIISFNLSTPSIKIVISLILFFLVTALFEEIIFRGIIQSFLEAHLGFLSVLILCTIIFTIPHLFNRGINGFSVISVLLGGVILTVLRYHSKDIIVPLGFHFVWNFVQGFLGLDVSGNQKIESFIKSTLHGNKLLTGGLFGFESSLITLSVLLIVAVFLVRHTLTNNMILQLESIKSAFKHLSRGL